MAPALSLTPVLEFEGKKINLFTVRDKLVVYELPYAFTPMNFKQMVHASDYFCNVRHCI